MESFAKSLSSGTLFHFLTFENQHYREEKAEQIRREGAREIETRERAATVQQGGESQREPRRRGRERDKSKLRC